MRRGDTLYSIAWRYGLDYRELAGWNGVRAPYVIYPGQSLRLSKPARVSRAVREAAPSASPPRDVPAQPVPLPDKPAARVPEPGPKPAAPRAPAASANTADDARSKTSASDASLDAVRVIKWQWPARGSLVTDFAATGGKGVDIAGRIGQPVHAAASGRVVYSGGGLRGYGKLIIVKHNKRFLSAYAHNNKLLVQEGDSVRVGQQIAEMGHSEADRVMLHFEIRRDGRPVDPLRYLPK